MTSPLILHGLDLSYFTGKIEAYLRVKDIPYRFQEMDTRDFEACARATGVRQMPQIECADGTWLTDSTLIIAHFERLHPSPNLTPVTPLARFASLFLEDAGDEMLWRPALYFRWAPQADARLMSERIARSMLRDVPLPLFLRRQFILRRQRRVYLRQDGVEAKTSGAIEALYHETLAALERVLADTPFLMGARPSAADFGFFGAMFRHFFCDPTPARIMRDEAPRTLAYVARLWALRAGDLAQAAPIDGLSAGAQHLMRFVAPTHLAELSAHVAAAHERRPIAQFTDRGALFKVKASPYRAWCLSQLKQAALSLGAEDQTTVRSIIGDNCFAMLTQDMPVLPQAPPTLPIAAGTAKVPLDRGLSEM